MLCGNLHDQQYIAAGLFDGDRHLGDLCPRCVLAGPVECAKQVREYSQRTAGRTAESNRLRIYHPKETIDGLPPKPKLPKAVAGEQGAMQLPPTQEELVALADGLALLKAWSITVDDMQEQEKAMLRQRFTGLYEEDLMRLVDDRYEEFFEEEPEVDPRF